MTVPLTAEQLLALDRAHLWHPYSGMVDAPPVFAVESAHGVRIKLMDGRELIDGMASWWSVIHGYNHPVINAAVTSQLARMAHVMFGGLTHEPAIALAARLVEITPAPLETVFFADSGSVSVEVAIKLAIQYWAARGRPDKQRLLTVRGGYHGDTLGAMSVCDPVTGMHTLFAQNLIRQLFAPRPRVRFGDVWHEDDIADMAQLLSTYADTIAAVIIEPIVQGAGGMWFYHAEYLRRLRALCDAHEVLLICDEIATGFGRTGKLFACDHSGVAPDILCLGKALTGGYMTLAATMTTRAIADVISRTPPGVFMHGPTFMANPLACAAALATIDLLLEGPWAARVGALEAALRDGLEACRGLGIVQDIRVLGAIGVIELKQAVDMRQMPHEFVSRGVWLRPFGRLVYVMPAYIMTPAEISALTQAMVEVVTKLDAATL